MTAHGAERSPVIAIAAVIAGVLLFAGFTAGYVSWAVSASQHRWCTTIDLLVAAPAPSGSPGKNPSRAYEQKLARDFRSLKGSLGC